jgi:iron complex outermembrane recepter protein
MKTKTTLMSSACLSLAFASAYAQDIEVAPEEGARKLATVTVTAQKREENLNDVPLSIVAFSGDALEESGVSEALELARLVPNFSAQRAAAVSNTRFNIRGIGAAGNTAVDPSVAIFLDGVYVARPSALYASFLDIASVEVVRGPQGTLFGRNTTAGGLILRSNDPAGEFEGVITADAGSFGSAKLQGMLNVPLSDRARFRIALQGSQLDGYGENLTTGRSFGEQESLAGRTSLSLDLTDAISWTVKADYSHITGDGQIASEALGSSLSPTALANLTIGLGGEANLPDLSDPTDWDVRQITTGNLKDIQTGVSSDLSWQLDDGHTLRLISGYRDYSNSQTDGDVIFTLVPLLSRTNTLDSEAVSHELQLVSPDSGIMDGRLKYVVGLYYYTEDAGFGEVFSITPLTCDLAPVPALRDACLASPLLNSSDLLFEQSSDSYAVFGQADYALTDTLAIQFGARFTRDERSGDYLQTATNPFVALAVRSPEDVSLSFEDEKPTYRLGLNWTPDADTLVFASFSTGYKAGGFNSGGGTPALGADRRVFDSEEATNYELGIKRSLADGRVQANATLYRTELDNFQDRSFDGVSFVTSNAGSLVHQGFEADVSWLATDNLTINASAAYLDSEFTDFKGASALPGCSPASPAIDGCGPVGGNRLIQDLTGGTANYAPEWSGALNAVWERDLNHGWHLRANGGLNFISEQFIGGVTDNNPQTLEDGYTLFNLRVSLASPDDGWLVSLYGENLSDEGYCNLHFRQPLDAAFGVRDAATGNTFIRCNPGTPRTWGASVTRKF